MTDNSNILFVVVFTSTHNSVCLPESTQYIGKFSSNTQNLPSVQFDLEKFYPEKQSGNKLSKTK